jgi:hypothetical protein
MTKTTQKIDVFLMKKRNVRKGKFSDEGEQLRDVNSKLE